MNKQDTITNRLRRGLTAWYDTAGSQDILYLEKEDDLQKAGKNSYDLIICTEFFEKTKCPSQVFRSIKSLLKDNGRLLVFANNRYGLKFFCGDIDPYTKKKFDGIDGYQRVKNGDAKGRMFSRRELEAMLLEAGFTDNKFFSVLPGLDEPVMILTDGYVPNEDMNNRISPAYNDPTGVFLEEETLWNDMIANGMLPRMANAYIIECSTDGKFSDVTAVTCTAERDDSLAMMTVIHDNKTVEKIPFDTEGKKQIKQLTENLKALSDRGIETVSVTENERGITMPFIEAPTGQKYLKDLLHKDVDEFLKSFDIFIEIIQKQSDIYINEDNEEMFRVAYQDMVPLNSFWCEDHFVFFDQEFTKNDYPVKAVMARAIATFYGGNVALEKLYLARDLYERYGLWDELGKWLSMEKEFLDEIRNEKLVGEHHNKTRRNDRMTAENRNKMDPPNKKYKIGYVAGAFDMFHTGHLRLIRRAKEQCEYLIVGVITDETIYHLKNRMPVIPLNERLEIVRACRYVDQAEYLPTEAAGIIDAYNRFKFDVMFSGDDHSTNEFWLHDQQILRTMGSDIVFFDYTKGVSSTSIRNSIMGAQ